MSHRHPLDPPHLHYAAQRLGVIVADGDMGMDEAREVIVAWARDVSGVDRLGLRMRLVHAMRDEAVALRRQRESVAMAIRWAVRPLFKARAAAAAIEEAAGRANGDVLPWEAVAAILGEEMAMARGARHAGRGAG